MNGQQSDVLQVLGAEALLTSQEEIYKYRFCIGSYQELLAKSIKIFVSPPITSNGVERIEWYIKVIPTYCGISEISGIACTFQKTSKTSSAYAAMKPRFFIVEKNGKCSQPFDHRRFLVSTEMEYLLFNGTLTFECHLRLVYSKIAKKRFGTNIVAVGLLELQSDLRELYESERNSDVVLRCGDKDFRVHKNILSARSSVFCRMFETDMKEGRESVVTLNEIPPETMRGMLQYVYCGELEEHTLEICIQLYSLADQYDIKGLKTVCSDSIASNLDVDRVCEAAIIAHLCNDEKLSAAAKDFVHAHMMDVMTSTGWVNVILNYQCLAKELVKKFQN